MARGRGRSSEKPRKKAKHGSRHGARSGKAQPWETADDIPLDGEEQFHKNLDKILLNTQDDDIGAEPHDWESEEEVFKLEGMPQSSDDESDDDDDPKNGVAEHNDVVQPRGRLPGTSAPDHLKKSGKPVHQPEPDSDASSYDSTEELERWGSNKATYYSTNAAILSSDDEEGNELEEKEAIRLQLKTRKDVTEDDFGLESSWNEEVVEELPNPLSEPASAVTSLPQDKDALLRHLEVNSPETLALAREWGGVVHELAKVEAALKGCSPDDPSLGLLHLHHQTLLTYVTTLAFYLHLRSQPEITSRTNLLRSHPIMSRLLTLKQALSELDALGFSAADDEDSDSLEEEDMETFIAGIPQWGRASDKELQDMLKEIEDKEADERAPKPRKKTSRPAPQDTLKPPKQKFDLVEPKFVSGKSSSRPATMGAPSVTDSDYGEQLSLQHSDLKDKDARRKSLKFYTAKIASASGRRERARVAVGGDDDIPYRERKKDKDARLMKNPTLGMGGDDLEAPESSSTLKRKGLQDADDTDPAEENEGGYYELVKRRKRELKEEKQTVYEVERDSNRIDEDTSMGEGPRSLTRAILTNKGLTPRRTKTARNPRVKKRQQFEKAKRKLSSKKAIYKGGLASTGGHYEGEKSGIAARVVKSVKLS